MSALRRSRSLLREVPPVPTPDPESSSDPVHSRFQPTGSRSESPSDVRTPNLIGQPPSLEDPSRSAGGGYLRQCRSEQVCHPFLSKPRSRRNVAPDRYKAPHYDAIA